MIVIRGVLIVLSKRYSFHCLTMSVKLSKKATKYEGKELPPEGTAAYEMMTRIGFWTITFIDRWCECTKSEKILNFPKYGTLNPRRLQFLHYVLDKEKPVP